MEGDSDELVSFSPMATLPSVQVQITPLLL